MNIPLFTVIPTVMRNSSFILRGIKSTATVVALILGAFNAHSQAIWDRQHLDNVKAQIERPMYAKAYESLLKQADALLDAAPFR